MLIDALAKKMNFDLREYGVSLISVEGLNFDSFLPLFGEQGLRIPVAVVTDADPFEEEVDAVAEGEQAEENIDDLLSEAAYQEETDAPDDEKPAGNTEKKKKVKRKEVYPALGDQVRLSANTIKMKNLEDDFVKVFHGLKTLEYDLALIEANRDPMLTALADPHPKISEALRKIVDAQPDNTAKTKALFCGMFERKGNGNIQKGRFAQSLAEQISKENGFEVPEYLKKAIQHVCQGVVKL